MSLLSVKAHFFIELVYFMVEDVEITATISMQRSVILWKTTGAGRRMYPFLPPMSGAMCGQDRFVRLLSREAIHRRGYNSAGIADVPIFI
jgi:hypothetical protein